MSEVYKALYDYTSAEKHVLSFKSGALLTLVSKNTSAWWSVRSEEGQTGMVPSNYLVKAEIPSGKNCLYEAEFDFTAMKPAQLSLKEGEKLKLLNDVSSEWWEMKNSQGQKGMVPVNYIKKSTSTDMPAPSSSNSSDEVLQSIDSAIQQIYDEMTTQGGQMTAQQRELLQKLTKHRQDVVNKSTGGKQKKQARRRAPSPPRKETPAEVEGSDGRDMSPAIVVPERPVQAGSMAPPLDPTVDVPSSSPLPPPLPTSFDISVGVRLANTVRSQTGVSFTESLAAAETTLRFVAQQIPQLSDVMEGLVGALEASQTSSDADLKIASSGDVDSLQHLFDLIRECRDDRQERSWAVRDDLGTIAGHLQEMLKLLSDADPEVCKLVLQDSKYENILVLVDYYQMELRWPLRLLLLQVFGSVFNLEPAAMSVCLNTVLPNVLGKDIQENKDELQNLLYVSLVATMLFSTGELLPLAVYDQWSVDFITELLDLVEDPPASDTEDQVPDSIVNVILSFNQHFQDPSRNLVLESLRDNPNRRTFGEKLMLLVNREEDPVALKDPLVPDSMTKLCIDLFSDRATAGLLYTSDLKVLVDIIARNLSDRGPGDEIRFHYLKLLHCLLGSTDYGEHLHRQDTLSTCLIRIHNEHEPEGKRDKEVVIQIWNAYPKYFQLSSSV